MSTANHTVPESLPEPSLHGILQFIFHITAHPPALRPSQGYFSSPFRQKTIHSPQQCLPGAYELHGEIYTLSVTVLFCSRHHQEQQHKSHNHCPHYFLIIYLKEYSVCVTV